MASTIRLRDVSVVQGSALPVLGRPAAHADSEVHADCSAPLRWLHVCCAELEDHVHAALLAHAGELPIEHARSSAAGQPRPTAGLHVRSAAPHISVL